MATLDGVEGEHCRCDRCKSEFHPYESDEWIRIHELWDRLFYRRPKRPLGDFCLQCAKEVTPLVYALRDADECILYVNKLGRAIDEKRRTQNDRPTQDHAG